MKYLNDFVKENGEFYNWEEFSEITNIQTNYLRYYGTVNALKEYIKKTNITCLHKEPNHFVPSHISPLLQQRKGSQVMYNILNKNNESNWKTYME